MLERRAYLGVFTCTAYSNRPEETDSDPDVTASGRQIVLGYSVALDPDYWGDLIRRGARLWVEGIGLVRADDTGSKVKGRYRLDLAVSNPTVARRLGRWQARVWLVD